MDAGGIERLAVEEIEPSAAGDHLSGRDRPAGKPLIGDEGVWFFLTADVFSFALFFAVFMVARHDAIELFEASRQQLDLGIGLLNTVILLTSSWLMALAVLEARKGDRARLVRYLSFSLLVGSGFAISKAYEYSTKITSGITLSTNDFFMYYFAFTGIHFLHFLVGIGVLIICLVKARSGPLDGRYRVFIESAGCYWHMVDLLWIVLFSMIYLLRLP